MGSNFSDERLMTVQEVAEVLGYHPRTVYNKVEDGSIPHIRLGKTIRFSPKDLTRWLEKRREQAA